VRKNLKQQIFGIFTFVIEAKENICYCIRKNPTKQKNEYKMMPVHKIKNTNAQTSSNTSKTSMK